MVADKKIGHRPGAMANFVQIPLPAYRREGCSGENVCEFLFEELLWLGTDNCALHFATLEKVNGRNGSDSILSGDGRVVVYVDLDYVNLFTILHGNLIQDRSELTAGPAPFGPEVHDYRLFGGQNVGAETCVSYIFSVAHNLIFLFG
jgi:hypothetical protein